MAEITLVPQPPVSMESNSAEERSVVVTEQNSSFVAVAPEFAVSVSDSTRTATDVSLEDSCSTLPTADTEYIFGTFGYDLHWLRETIPGKLDGLGGLRLPAEQTFEAWIETKPTFPGADPNVRVLIAQADPALPSSLLLAMLGVHPLEWAWSLFSDVGSVAWRGTAQEANVPTETMEEFHRLWCGLGPDGRSSLWTAAARGEEGLEWLLEVLEDEANKPQTPPTSPVRDGVRILKRTQLRQLFLYVNRQARKHFHPERLAEAFADFAKFSDMNPWIRRRLGSLLNSTGDETFAALTTRLPLLRILEQRVLSSVRGLLAAQIADPQTRTEEFHPKDPRSGRFLALHLPFLDRRKVLREPFDWTNPRLFEMGRSSLFVCSAWEHPMLSVAESDVLQTLALPLRQAEGGSLPRQGEIAFSYHHTPDPRWSDPFWRDIVESYGFDPALASEPATLTVSAPMELLQAWSRVPNTREASFFPAFSKVAQVLQRSARQWVPALYFQTPDPIVDLHAALPVLLYQAVEPFGGRARCHLSYDPMDPSDLQRAIKSASRKFCRSMSKILAEFDARGERIEAQDFLLRDPQQLVKWVARHPRQLVNLLSLEAYLIEEFIRLGEFLRELRAALATTNNGHAVRQFGAMVEDVITALNRKLRKVHGRDLSILAPILLLEATNALHPQSATVATLKVGEGKRARVYRSNAARFEEKQAA